MNSDVRAFGSSPRMRGTERQRVFATRRDRFIPARAGNGRVTATLCSTVSVHPRACGERRSTAESRSRLNGSSPRVRGTAFRSVARGVWYRFIPARAGNGGYGEKERGPGAVHPRACGEREEFGGFHEEGSGSSPRVRGTAFDGGEPITIERFIPARAGNGLPVIY